MLDIVEPGQDKNRRVIGIDLGTTYSLVATSKNGNVTFFNDKNDKSAVPSAVYYDAKGNAVVGTKAQERLVEGASDVFYSMKRLLGKASGDVGDFQIHVPFELTTTEGMVYACAGAFKKTPIEVSADILAALKKRAEEQMGGAVYDAVITVPAYFNEAQRQATKDAAKIAGLNVLRLISEPTAAALAYGLDSKSKGTFLIYDFGGGTFDVSLLKLTDGVFRVMATGGDTYLGGDDIDKAIATHCAISMIEARALKEEMCNGKENSKLSIEEMNTLATPFIQRTIDICEGVLEDADIDEDNIDGIVLVGGSTRMPLVYEMIEKHFGMTPENGINPDKVVAHGAALQAEALTGGNRDAMLLLDVTPLSLGLETVGGLVEKVIYRNTPIPITKAQTFTTFKDGQNAMDIHVLQGERETVNDCRSLAKFRLKGIPAMAAGVARIQVIFALDADGMLSVQAKEESTGVQQSIDVVPSYGLSQEEVLEMLKSSMTNAKADVELRQLNESKLELERVIDACASALKLDGALLVEDAKSSLQNALDEGRKGLDLTDKDDVEDTMHALEKAFQTFSEDRVNRALRQAIVGQNINEEKK
tara:strand:- start:25375 stop:27141 length:1767 start_codon:yes stop_codon:yes gene_type:complete